MDVSSLKSDFILISRFSEASSKKKGVENQSFHQTACYSNFFKCLFILIFQHYFHVCVYVL